MRVPGMVSSEIPQPAASLGVFLVEHGYKCDKCSKTHTGSGTCFLLDVPGTVSYFLTNYHVVEGDDRNVKIVGTMPGLEGKFSGRVIGVDKGKDLALMRSHDIPKGLYASCMLAARSPPVGTRVEILGYPLSYVWPDVGKSDVQRRAWFPLTYTKPTLEKYMMFTGHHGYDGQSGSPGFARGQVVCVFFGRTEDGAVGSSVEDIRDFLYDAALSLPERKELQVYGLHKGGMR